MRELILIFQAFMQRIKFTCKRCSSTECVITKTHIDPFTDRWKFKVQCSDCGATHV